MFKELTVETVNELESLYKDYYDVKRYSKEIAELREILKRRFPNDQSAHMTLNKAVLITCIMCDELETNINGCLYDSNRADE